MLFFESEYSEVFKTDKNKLFTSTCNEKQTDNHSLMFDILHSRMSVVCTYNCGGVFEKIFWRSCCSLLIFVTKKATKGTEIQSLCSQGTLQGGRIWWCLLGTCSYNNFMFQKFSTNTKRITWDVFHALHPNISMHILHTILYTFPNVLAGRIYLTNKRFFSWLSFTLFSWP